MFAATYDANSRLSSVTYPFGLAVDVVADKGYFKNEDIEACEAAARV
jgi:hypothetical protein